MLLSPQEARKQGLGKNDLGGKGYHLLQMEQAGLQVPPFLLLPCRTLDHILQPIREEIEEICAGLALANEAEFSRSAQQFQQIITQLQPEEQIQQAIIERCRAVFGQDFQIAVRSSALGEDGEGSSFAGIHETILYVSEANIIPSILQSISSVWSSSALRYRIAKGIAITNIQYAIVLQQMLSATRSGV
ncbi:MAG: PEP/pyruvate-binding domain-containing protein, partial [Bacteroidota bacterium]